MRSYLENKGVELTSLKLAQFLFQHEYQGRAIISSARTRHANNMCVVILKKKEMYQNGCFQIMELSNNSVRGGGSNDVAAFFESICTLINSQ